MENPNINNLETIEVLSAEERWNTYLLADGMVLRLKATLVKVKKDPSSKDQDGNPNYLAKTQIVLDYEPAKKSQ